MPKKRSWSDEQLGKAVSASKSVRAVIIKVGLVPAGGNYDQINQRIQDLKLNTAHFTGKGWNKGMKVPTKPRVPLQKLLVNGSTVQSYKLKAKLFIAGMKNPKCELCGWAEEAQGGRIPVELDHINGKRHDNRIENLRILCPNCHSLQTTHRGRNKKTRLARMVE